MIENVNLWDRIHQRLKEIDKALNDVSDEPSPAAVQQIMTARARELAQAPEELRRSDQHTALVFTLGGELYAADVDFVKGVIRPAVYTPVPGVPSFIAGIANHRGLILTTLDLRPFFGLQRGESIEDGAILVVETGGVTAGVLAETIEEITEISLTQQQSPLLTLTGTRAEYTSAVVSYGEQLVAVLNIPALLKDQRLVVDEEV